jgi:hypothetical protein
MEQMDTARTPRSGGLGVLVLLALALTLAVGSSPSAADLSGGCHAHGMYPKFKDEGNGYRVQGRARFHNCARRSDPYTLTVALQWRHPERGWSAPIMAAHAAGAETRNWVWVSYGTGVNCPSTIRWRSWFRINGGEPRLSDPISRSCG